MEPKWEWSGAVSLTWPEQTKTFPQRTLVSVCVTPEAFEVTVICIGSVDGVMFPSVILQLPLATATVVMIGVGTALLGVTVSVRVSPAVVALAAP